MIKQLLIKWGLWEEKNLGTFFTESPDPYIWKEALRHYCNPCNRWFSDVRGKLMHDRHRHKDE